MRSDDFIAHAKVVGWYDAVADSSLAAPQWLRDGRGGKVRRAARRLGLGYDLDDYEIQQKLALSYGHARWCNTR